MRRALVFGFALTAAFVVTRTSDAHFHLDAPPSWLVLDSLGMPQKLGPCGDEYDGTDAAVPSGVVSAYQVGDTITVTITETVFHPGHYRIALGDPDRSALPPEPAVDAGSGYPCGTAVIENPPVYPVLADDVFDHSAPFTGPQTTTVKLPSNVTCTHCTLQIIQFMSDHGLNNPGGCFYHHCADISIGQTSPSDGGVDGSAEGGPSQTDAGAEPEPPSSGCSCDTAPRSSTGVAALLSVIGLSFVFRASRRRKRR